MASINKPIPGSRNPVSYIDGLTARVLSGTTLTLSAGSCSDSINNIEMMISDAITINAAVNGINGLDTGSLAANAFYYVYVIGDSGGNHLSKSILSASIVAPKLPYGYDSWRMVDIKLTGGSTSFVPSYTISNGVHRKFVYTTPYPITGIDLIATYDVEALNLCVAPVALSNVSFEVIFDPDVAGDIVYMSIDGVNDYAEISGPVVGVPQVTDVECPALLVTSVPSIYLKSSNINTVELYVKSFGYTV